MEEDRKQWGIYAPEELVELIKRYESRENLMLTASQISFCVKSLLALQERHGRIEHMDVYRTLSVVSGQALSEDEPLSAGEGNTSAPALHEHLLNRGRGRPSTETLEWLRGEYLRLTLQQQQMQQLINEIRAALARYDQSLATNIS